MKKINRTSLFSALLVLAYLLSACSGAPGGQNVNSSDDQQTQNGQVQEVVFTGTVEAVEGNQWTISGQTITVDVAASVAASIAVGDNVKVEARVAQDGTVTAVSIEISGADDANANDDNQNDGNANSNDNQDDNSNSDNSNNDNSNGNDNSSTGVEQEVSGVVEEITTASITISGVVYAIADFTEFKDIIAVGDQVKAHVIANADGTFTIREIEKSDVVGDDNSNSNSNDDNGNDDNGNDDNSNDDNGNDDNGNDDNGNDDNGNDDDGNDDNSNDNNDNG